MANKSHIQLCGICQDNTSLQESFAPVYFLKIGGVQNHDTAVSFVNLVKTTPELLASDELYKHVHDDHDMSIHIPIRFLAYYAISLG